MAAPIKPNTTYSAGADASYICFADEPAEWTQELDDRRMIDWGAGNVLVGVELLDVSDGIDLQDVPERSRVQKALRVFTVPIVA